MIEATSPYTLSINLLKKSKEIPKESIRAIYQEKMSRQELSDKINELQKLICSYADSLEKIPLESRNTKYSVLLRECVNLNNSRFNLQRIFNGKSPLCFSYSQESPLSRDPT